MKLKIINIILFLVLIFIILSQLYNLRENIDNQSSCDDIRVKNDILSSKIDDLDKQIDTQKQEQTQIQQKLQEQISSQKTIIDGQKQNNICNDALSKLEDFKQQMQKTTNSLKNILP